MRIIDAKPEDAAALSEIARVAKESWGYPRSWLVAWEGLLTVSPQYLGTHASFVAVEGETTAGFAVVEISGHTAQLAHLWVLPAKMRSGIGRALFRRCEEAARLAGAEWLEIESDPHAEEFYRRMGAVRVGQRSADMEGVARSLPVLRKRLQ